MSLLFILDLLCAALFAVSGVLVFGRKSLHLLGVVVSVIVTPPMRGTGTRGRVSLREAGEL